jgi:hypothetical protein
LIRRTFFVIIKLGFLVLIGCDCLIITGFGLVKRVSTFFARESAVLQFLNTIGAKLVEAKIATNQMFRSKLALFAALPLTQMTTVVWGRGTTTR